MSERELKTMLSRRESRLSPWTCDSFVDLRGNETNRDLQECNVLRVGLM